jgi:Domain of unknown function (DUF4372)
MHTGKLVFAQLMEHLPLTTFRRSVARSRGHHKVQRFGCLDQYLSMAFAQLTYRESLRDIEACLRAQASKLYHLGIRSTVARNTLANANATRDWAYLLRLRPESDSHGTAALCQRTLWSRAQRNRLRIGCHHHRFVSVGVSLGAVSVDQSSDQVAYLARPARQYPFVYSDQRWQVAREQRARRADYRTGRFYVMDRGYIDFERLGRLNEVGSSFCIGILNHLSFWPEPYRRAGGMSIVFLFDEESQCCFGWLGRRSARRGAKCSRSRGALELRASGAVGSRWQPVFGSSDCLE